MILWWLLTLPPSRCSAAAAHNIMGPVFLKTTSQDVANYFGITQAPGVCQMLLLALYVSCAEKAKAPGEDCCEDC